MTARKVTQPLSRLSGITGWQRRPFGRRRHVSRALTVAATVLGSVTFPSSQSYWRPTEAPDRAAVAPSPAFPRVQAATTAVAFPRGSETEGCKPPPLPAPTYPGHPSGAGYGVPFVARLIDGQMVGGYDEQWAAGHFDPWKARIFNITGWVAGRLQVPSLTGQIEASGIVFCTQTTPVYAIFKQGTSRPVHPFITNEPGVPDSIYLPVVASITPVGSAELSVTGVQPNGSLDVSGSAAGAITLVDHTGTNQTCTQFAPTTLNISTEVTPEPKSGPPGVGLIPAFTPKPVVGPLRRAAGTVAGNDFAVTAFDQTKGHCLLATLLNAELAGTNSQGVLQYPNPCLPHCPVVAAPPGWTQFMAKVRITQLGLPVGVPPGFSF